MLVAYEGVGAAELGTHSCDYSKMTQNLWVKFEDS